MIGLEERTTQSGIHVFRVHFSADPDKRSDEWQVDAAKGMPGGRKGRMWRREMEIDWTIASGLPVYECFSREAHVASEPIPALDKAVILRGWDFGLTPACVFCQLTPLGGLEVLVSHQAWSGRGPMVQQSIDTFAREVTILSGQWFYGHTFRDYADPAGWQRSQADSTTCIQIMAQMGIHAIPGPVAWQARKHAVNDVLMRRGGLTVSPSASMIVEGFEGAYKYAPIGDTGRYKDEVEKNAWSHPMNALEYVIGGVMGNKTEQRAPRSRPRTRDRMTGY